MPTAEYPGKSELLPTPKSEFLQRLEQRWERGNFVCIGLDSDYSQIPQIFREGYSIDDAIFRFNQEIIDATAEYACAFKPNTAFYEPHGEDGLRALRGTISYIKANYPDITVILDAKRGDIGNTNTGYVKTAFDELGADAVTVHPYLGREAMKPFLDRKDKGIIVLARTSNPGAGEFQDLLVDGVQLYQIIAGHVAESWNENGNCAVVVGATYPKELSEVRAIVGDMPILIPGIGAQGGEVESSVMAGKDSRGWGMIVNSSRGIIFAKEGAGQAAARLNDEINQYR